jgi:TRAP-type C4-dicarboxylate transport system permease small subunit
LKTQATSTTPAVTLTRFIHKIDGALDYVYRAFGYICGTLLLLLGIYITYQVIVRKLGGPVLGNQELVGGYILAFAGTWAFSYSLRTGSHVRIDVLLPLFSRIHPYMRALADWMALASVGFFGVITAWYAWKEVFKSFCIRNEANVASTGIDRFVMGVLGEDDPSRVALACKPALANTYLIGNFLPELWMFQLIVAIGFTMLAFTSFQWMLSMILRGLLEIWHKNSGGDVSELAVDVDIPQEAASGV